MQHGGYDGHLRQASVTPYLKDEIRIDATRKTCLAEKHAAVAAGLISIKPAAIGKGRTRKESQVSSRTNGGCHVLQ
jgi:hypothetical protein